MKNIFKKPFVKTSLFTFGGILVFYILMNYILLPFYVSGKEVVVPKVVGTMLAEALQRLSDAGLNPVVKDTIYGLPGIKGSVSNQSPAFGSKVKSGRQVILHVCGGDEIVKMPKVTGYSFEQARQILKDNSLKNVEPSYEDSELPPNEVIRQLPEAGAVVGKSKTIQLFISQGKSIEQVKVPNLIGRSLAEAEKILAKNSLTRGRIYYQNSKKVLPNTVYNQSPSEGESVNKGAYVEVYVYKESENVEVIPADTTK